MCISRKFGVLTTAMTCRVTQDKHAKSGLTKTRETIDSGVDLPASEDRGDIADKSCYEKD